MNLNNIKLSAFLVSDFYGSALVAGTEPGVKVKEVPKLVDKKYLGQFRKKVLIVVHYADAVHINDSALEFLTTILGACKLTLADVGILNAEGLDPEDIRSLMDQWQPETAILFGLDASGAGLPVRFPHYQRQKLENCTYISSPALEEIQDDKELKGKLWAGLRLIFNV